MGVVELFQRRGTITEDEAKALRATGGAIGSPKGITADDVLRIFPGARIVPRKSDFEMWLEAQGVLEADRQAILEDAERWTLKEGGWQRTAEVRKGPHTCKHCSDGAKIIMRTWPNSKWDWMRRCCGARGEGEMIRPDAGLCGDTGIEIKSYASERK